MITVVAREADFDLAVLPSQDKLDKAAGNILSKDVQAIKDEMSNLTGMFWNAPGDGGSLMMIKVGGMSLRRNETGEVPHLMLSAARRCARFATPRNTSLNCPRQNTIPLNGRPRWRRYCSLRNMTGQRMFARIGIMRALNRGHARSLIPRARIPIGDAASWREIDHRQSAQPTFREKGMNGSGTPAPRIRF